MTELHDAIMKNFKKGHDPKDIVEYAKILETANSDDIYIWFIGSDSPVVFGRSAICLKSYFPEIELSQGDGQVVSGRIMFPFRRVLDEFCRYQQLVDDHCLHIVGVTVLQPH